MADPIFNYVAANPFGLSDVGSEASPTLVDIDGDGDLDAFTGNYDGNTLFFKNTGTVNSPSFILIRKILQLAEANVLGEVR